MWQLDNGTPFAADRGWVRDRDGSEVWLVVVKATFELNGDGGLGLARQQPPVLRVPQYFGDPGASSVKYDADLVLRKANTDIVVVGSAHAPAGQAVAEMDVGFQVGSVQKRLRVFGDRRWGSFGLGSPSPFECMPVVYERAFGGVDAHSSNPQRDWEWRNPVGRGYAVQRRHLQASLAPNVEQVTDPIRDWDDRPAPAGFGVVAAHWQPRASFAGTYDDHWKRSRRPLLPDDFNESFFQSVPADQQAPGFLKGGEPVVIFNMHPSG